MRNLGMEIAVEALANLLYLIKEGADKPEQVREYVEWAQGPMRTLIEATIANAAVQPEATGDASEGESD